MENFIYILRSLKINPLVFEPKEDCVRFGSIYDGGDWTYDEYSKIATRKTAFFMNEDEKFIKVNKYINENGIVRKIYEEII